MEGWNKDGDSANVFVSIRFLQHTHQCFSDWTNQEMKVFWGFIDKVHEYTWTLIYASGGKIDKSGLAYTPLKIDQYPKSVFRDNLDPEITLFELRASEEIRIHGFRNRSVFYICWLDRGHEICKM